MAQFSCLLALANSTHSDRTNEKFWHSTWPLLMGIVGFIISIGELRKKKTGE